MSMSDYLQNCSASMASVAVVIGGTGVLGGDVVRRAWRRPGPRSSSPAAAPNAGSERVAKIEKPRRQGDALSRSMPRVASRCKRCSTRSSTSTAASHALVNCAGVNSPTPYFDITDDEFDTHHRHQPVATHLGCQIFGKHMVEAGGGAILNIGSVTAYLPLSRVFAYSASKAAVLNLTQNVAREFAPHRRARQLPLPRLLPRRAEPQDPRQERASNRSCATRRWAGSASAGADRRDAAAALARSPAASSPAKRSTSTAASRR